MTVKDLIQQLAAFKGSPREYLVNFLAVQSFLAKAEGGAILRLNQENSVDVLAVYPRLEQGAPAPAWLAQSVQLTTKVFQSGGTVVSPLKLSDQSLADQEKHYIMMTPIALADTGKAVAAFRITAQDKAALELSRQKIELISALSANSDLRLLRQGHREDLLRLKRAMETVSSMNRETRFKSAAMAFCNEVAAQWGCERVSLGFLQGRFIQVCAMSHTEDFSRKMEGIQAIEAAMEECLDQDVEVLYPAAEDATYIVRAAASLASSKASLSVLSMPLRFAGKTLAVITLERGDDKAFALEAIESLRLACELCTARLVNLFEQDRWFGARWAAKTRGGLSRLVGAERTWTKLLAILGCAAIIFLIVAKGDFRVKAPFAMEAITLQAVPAPFDGYLKDVSVEVGDEVTGAESELAQLDTAELRLELAAAMADRVSFVKQAAQAMRDRETAKAQIAQANADKAQAQVDLLNYKLKQAALLAPIDGVITKGDLKRQIGAPVQTGDVLFEVAPLDALRAELMVPEEDIYEVAKNQPGFLATASYPGQRINFVVERINPVAEVVENRNVFKVRVRLKEIPVWMRPGMEGVAKITIGPRRYVWIWTRKIVNWFRMKLWF